MNPVYGCACHLIIASRLLSTSDPENLSSSMTPLALTVLLGVPSTGMLPTGLIKILRDSSRNWLSYAIM